MSEKIIKVRVTAGAKTEKIEALSDGSFKIRVQEPPENGKANKRILELIAEYFNIPKSKPVIISGHTYKEKIISINI